jgi:predicted ATPase
MAVHTGSIEPDGDDYRGPVVNRVARLEGLAHGGQVLLSESTVALTADTLPAGTTVRDLGAHLLRGMARAERVYQLEAAGLAGDFAPLRSEGSAGVPLPSYPTSFVGRSEEIKEICTLLDESHRLVTLLGPGGIGKTRLAVESARHAADGVGGRTFFADLAPLSDADDVGLAVAEAVGAHVEGTASPVTMAAARVAEPSLLVLDNFEHVHEAAPAIAELLEAAAEIQVITTSRSPLNIRGERILHIEPLSLANGDGSTPPALALFYERVAGYGVTISDTPAERKAAATIVGRLDGLPLAIELVAARARIVGLGELAAMLDESLDALGTGAADAPDRQKTIRSTIEWSLQGLTSAQRALFAHAAIFPAGATLDQLAAIEKEISKTEIMDNLTALVDNSLVSVVTGRPGGTRYRQLVLLRDYGLERLRAASAYDTTMGRLVDYYVDVAPALGERSQTSGIPNQELAVDHANLLAAMNWSIAAGRSQDMVDVLCTLWFYWFDSDATSGVWDWAQAAVPALNSPKADWLYGLTALLMGGDVATATALMSRARDGFAAAGEEEWAARASIFMSTFAQDPDEGMALAQQGVDYFSQFEPGLDLYMARFNASAFLFRAGDLDTAITIRREILEWAESENFERMISWGHWQLALALVAAGDLEARDHNLIHLDNMAIDGFLQGVACATDIEAVIRILRGDLEAGLRILGGSEAIYESLGHPVRFPEATLHVDHAMEVAMRELGDERVRELMNEGGRLSLEELQELAHS